MANFTPTDSFNVSTVTKVEPTDAVLAEFVNGYYQSFLDNDNYLGKRVAEDRAVAEVTLGATKWTGTEAPYTQTVAVSSMGATDSPVLVSLLDTAATAATAKAYNKAFSIIANGTATTADGSVTFKVYKKPETTIKVGLFGKHSGGTSGMVLMIPGGSDYSDELTDIQSDIDANAAAITAEETRAKTAEATLATDLTAEIARAKAAEEAINAELDGVADLLAGI